MYLQEKYELKANDAPDKLMYIIDSYISHGGTAVTYKAHNGFNNSYIIKEIYPNFISKADGLRRDGACIKCDDIYQNEFMLIKKSFLKQCKMYSDMVGFDSDYCLLRQEDYFELNNTVYAAYTYSKGDVLCNYVKNKNRTFDIKTAATIIKSLVNSLRVVHSKGILHLDISPDNIYIIEREDGNVEVRLIDYGNAAKYQNDNEDSDEACVDNEDCFLMYKEYYSAPELYERVVLGEIDNKIGIAADIYSIAAVMYYLAFGFKAPSFFYSVISEQIVLKYKNNDFCNDYSPHACHLYEKILRRGLSDAAEKRYQSCDELLTDVNKLFEAVQQEKYFRYSYEDNYKLFTDVEFYGRTKELNEIYDYVFTDTNNFKSADNNFKHNYLFVTGKNGSGKTALVFEFLKKYRYEYDNCCYMPYMNTIANLWLQPLQSKFVVGNDLLAQNYDIQNLYLFLSNLKGRNIFVVDFINNEADFIQNIPYLLSITAKENFWIFIGNNDCIEYISSSTAFSYKRKEIVVYEFTTNELYKVFINQKYQEIQKCFNFTQNFHILQWLYNNFQDYEDCNNMDFDAMLGSFSNEMRNIINNISYINTQIINFNFLQLDKNLNYVASSKLPNGKIIAGIALNTIKEEIGKFTKNFDSLNS